MQHHQAPSWCRLLGCHCVHLLLRMDAPFDLVRAVLAASTIPKTLDSTVPPYKPLPTLVSQAGSSAVVFLPVCLCVLMCQLAAANQVRPPVAGHHCTCRAAALCARGHLWCAQ